MDQAYLHIDLADHLIHELRETTSPRIVFILGAGSLETDGGRLYDLLKKDPHAPSFINTPKESAQRISVVAMD